MPITRSAKKALRSSLRKRHFNRIRKEDMSATVKEVKKLVASNDKKAAMNALSLAQSALDKAAKGKTIDKNTASRKKSRLSKMIKKIA